VSYAGLGKGASSGSEAAASLSGVESGIHLDIASWPSVIGAAVASIAVTHALGVGCSFRAATGLDFPTCGGTRAFVNLLHGRVVGALHYNLAAVLLALILVPLLILRWRGWTMPKAVTESVIGRHPAVVIVGLLISWTVLRNLPGMEWFSTVWATR
jgi:hypothetical protein